MYKEEKRVKQLAIYYVASNFNEEHVEELYTLLKFLVGKIARKSYEKYDKEDLIEIEHNIALEIILNLKMKKVKPDLEAWMRYIIVVVRNRLYVDERKYAYRAEELDLNKFEDINSKEQIRNIEIDKMIDSFVIDYMKSMDVFSFFKQNGLMNLLLYCGIINTFDDFNMGKLLPMRCTTLISMCSCRLKEILYEQSN